MATLYVTEYLSTGQIAGSQVPQEPAVVSYSMTITGVSAQSQVFNAKTRMVELTTDAACSIEIGTNPTAVPTARRMPANQTIFRGVPEGGSFRVAVITNS